MSLTDLLAELVEAEQALSEWTAKYDGETQPVELDMRRARFWIHTDEREIDRIRRAMEDGCYYDPVWQGGEVVTFKGSDGTGYTYDGSKITPEIEGE